MSEVKNYSITKIIGFYINKASLETIAGHRIYLETALAPRLRKGLAVLSNIDLPEQEGIELHDVYQHGVDFFDKLFDAPVPQVNTTTSNQSTNLAHFLPDFDFATQVTSDLIGKQNEQIQLSLGIHHV